MKLRFGLLITLMCLCSGLKAESACPIWPKWTMGISTGLGKYTGFENKIFNNSPQIPWQLDAHIRRENVYPRGIFTELGLSAGRFYGMDSQKPSRFISNTLALSVIVGYSQKLSKSASISFKTGVSFIRLNSKQFGYFGTDNSWVDESLYWKQLGIPTGIEIEKRINWRNSIGFYFADNFTRNQWEGGKWSHFLTSGIRFRITIREPSHFITF